MESALDRARRLVSGLAITLRETRKQEGVTMRQLADQIGIAAPILSYIETSRWIPTPGEAEILTEWLLEHPLLNGHAVERESSAEEVDDPEDRKHHEHDQDDRFDQS